MKKYWLFIGPAILFLFIAVVMAQRSINNWADQKIAVKKTTVEMEQPQEEAIELSEFDDNSLEFDEESEEENIF